MLLAPLLGALPATQSATAAEGCPADQPCVIVSVIGAQPSQHVITAAQVAAGDVNALYELRSRVGGPTIQDNLTGISIRDMLQNDVGIAIGSVTFTETTVRGSGGHLLSQADLADPSSPGYPFVDGRLPAIYTTGNDALGYIEPLRPGDQPNTFLETNSNGVILMTVHTTGQILKPVVTASTATAHATAPVKFSASFASSPGTAISYSWDFGAGASGQAVGATVSHTYPRSGTYRVTVTATGADGSFGISAPVTVQVGNAVPPKKGSGTGTSPSPGPTTGPNTGTGSRGGGTPSATPTTSQAIGGADGTDATGDSPTGGSETPQVIGTLITGSAAVVTPKKSRAAEATAPAATIGGLAEIAWKSVAGLGAAALLGLGVLAETGVLGAWRERRRKGTR